MHETLFGLLERADLAIAASRTVVGADITDPLSRVVADARTRLLYPEDVLVVALAGGTGSGKSSLFNLLTGLENAEIGVARPTTSDALAAMPSRYAHALDSFLDEIGVTRRVEQDRLQGVCLIDLPDTDSIETDHRLRVEALLPRLDVLVWVVDPEKYRDAALHHRYIRPLSDYASQFVVVFNQIDRLGPTAVDQVVDDLRTALVDDGLEGVEVVRTSAQPPAGPPIGIEQLSGVLERMSERRDLLYSKLLVDLDRASSELARSIGGPVGYREEAEAVVEIAAHHLNDGATGDAVDELVGFVGGLAELAGGQTGSSLRRFASALPEKIHEIVTTLPSGEAPTKWWRRSGGEAVDRTELSRQKLVGLLEPVEELLGLRARAGAASTEFALAVASVRGRSLS